MNVEGTMARRSCNYFRIHRLGVGFVGDFLVGGLQARRVVSWLKENQFASEMAKDFAKGEAVNTVWGCGYIEQIRSTDYVVKLKCWNLAQGQSPTLYLQKETLKRMPQNVFPGNEVKTFVGPCTIIKVRRDNTFVCAPAVWHLADYSPNIFMYMNAESIQAN